MMLVIKSSHLGYKCNEEFVANRINNLDENRERVFVAQINDIVVGYIHAEIYNTLYFDSVVNIFGLAVLSGYNMKAL